MPSYPKVSIVTVVLNAARDFESTFDSIISQSYSNWESIVIDGGSNNDTINVIKKYSEFINYWVSEPDKGIYDAMNKGLKHSVGDYVTFLNAGDKYSDKDALSRIFEKNNKEHLIYGNINVFGSNEDNPSYQKAMDFSKENLLRFGTGVLCHQAAFVRKDIAPIYNTNFKYKAELNWYFDLVDNVKGLTIKHVDTPVVNYYLGGYGYVNFLSNLLDLCRLIILRYGIKTFLLYNYPKIIWRKLGYRYPKIFRSKLFRKTK